MKKQKQKKTKNKKLISSILYLVFCITFLSLVFNLKSSVSAQDGSSPICIPAECSEYGKYEPDFACINKQLLDPRAKNPENKDVYCCENKCKDDPKGTERPEEYQVLFSFFGNTLAVTKGQQIPVLINLAVTTFLGFVSVYALVMGIYLGGYVRSRTTDAAEIEQLNKQFMSLVIGFFLAWGFLVIIQVVANLIGLGSLSDLQLIGEGGTQIIIN